MQQPAVLLIILIITINFSQPSLARPVSYPQGWTSMLMMNSDTNSLHIHYSPSAKYSLGYRAEDWLDEDYQIHALQVNTLLKRWNEESSQANLYLKSAIGAAYGDDDMGFDDGAEASAFVGIAADWETRRYFISYENRYTKISSVDDFYMQSLRLGIAPYIGDYGDLHTWLMVEVEHKPEKRDALMANFIVRLFKGSHLVEAGVSDQGDAMFNWVYRY